VLLWTALVVGAAGVMFLLARSLWRKSMALLDEFGAAVDRLGTLDQELSTLAERTTQADDLAVADPRSCAGPPPDPVGHRWFTPQACHRAAAVRPTEPGRLLRDEVSSDCGDHAVSGLGSAVRVSRDGPSSRASCPYDDGRRIDSLRGRHHGGMSGAGT
jgi:hypothetical protein